MLSALASRMLTPSEHDAVGDDPRATYELTQHLGKSLALLGVMLIFLGALLRAEARELDAWRMRSLREATALAAPVRAAANANAVSSSGAALETFDPQSPATRAFDRALFIASIGVALAALALALRRGNGWFTAVALALACLVLSTHQYKIGRAQLSQGESALR